MPHIQYTEETVFRNGSDEGAVKETSPTERKTSMEYLPSTLVVLPTLHTFPDWNRCPTMFIRLGMSTTKLCAWPSTSAPPKARNTSEERSCRPWTLDNGPVRQGTASASEDPERGRLFHSNHLFRQPCRLPLRQSSRLPVARSECNFDAN